MLQKWKQNYIKVIIKKQGKKSLKIITKIYKIMKWFDIFGQVYMIHDQMLIIQSITCSKSKTDTLQWLQETKYVLCYTKI